MAASLALPPWSSIWSQPRSSQQAASSADCQISHPERITEHATDAILKLVTSEACTYGSRSRRFVFEGTREAVEHLPMQQDSRAASGSSTPRHADLNGDQTAAKGAHATGSSIAGSKGHTAVGCICRDSLGDAELAAFMRLCGELLESQCRDTGPQDELEHDAGLCMFHFCTRCHSLKKVSIPCAQAVCAEQVRMEWSIWLQPWHGRRGRV